jgi:selenocysteine-specific translation elongation factor
VAVTKAELPVAKEVHAALSNQLDTPPLLISAVTGQGLQELTRGIAQLLSVSATS